MRVAAIAQMVMTIRRMAASGAGGFCAVGYVGTAVSLLASEQIRKHAPVAGIDTDLDAHRGAEYRLPGFTLDADAHRDALHDLHIVSASVLRRQYREVGGARGTDAV